LSTLGCQKQVDLRNGKRDRQASLIEIPGTSYLTWWNSGDILLNL
jgi:hypothetical protein